MPPLYLLDFYDSCVGQDTEPGSQYCLVHLQLHPLDEFNPSENWIQTKVRCAFTDLTKNYYFWI